MCDIKIVTMIVIRSLNHGEGNVRDMAFTRNGLHALAFVMLLSLQGTLSRHPKSNEGRVRDYILQQENFSPRDRPVINSSDTVFVGVNLQFYAMIDLNERDQIITTATWMTLVWKDERLTWDPEEFGGETSVVVYIDEIWTPKIFIANVLSTDNLILFSAERGLILVNSDGTTSLGTPIVQATHCPVIIDYFPYDTQVCPFYIFPENLPVEKMCLYALPPTHQSSLPSSEWNFTHITSHNHSYVFDEESSTTLAFATFCLFLERYPNYYINTLIIPSTLLCLLSFVTFLAPPDSGERISLGVSMVLGLTVFQLLVADILPSASKQDPILSFYLIVTFCLAGLTVPLSLLNIKIAYGDSKITILKYSFLRKAFLEYLPRICSVPTYSERIKQMITIKPRGSNDIPKTEGTIAATGEDESNELARQLFKIEEFITNADKTKIEARTVALVFDRICLVGCLICFTAFFVETILDFSRNPGVSDDFCEEPNFI